MRNFKSFKQVDVQLPQSFICLAGPNGSGKSNFTDAIRFALGEISLKSLRAKKVKDLIFHDALAAEVMLILEGEDGKYEIKRAIRRDGKILYRLNGKKTTRWAILESLKKHNLDDSGRNTIAQGEVQRIVNMGGKERRTIIDSVAGISDFEEKKAEAMKELDIVDGRIKDANLVLGERMAFLEDLRKEREIALQYMDSKKKFNNAKGSLLKTEMTRHEKELKTVVENESKLRFSIENKEAELREIEAKIADMDSKRLESSKELQARQQARNLIKKVEELKASIQAKMQIVADKENGLKKLEEERLNEKQIASEDSVIKTLDAEIDRLKKELAEKEKELRAGSDSTEAASLLETRKMIDGLKKEYDSLRERVITLDSDAKAKNEIAEIKQTEFESIEIKWDEAENSKVRNEIQGLTRESSDISSEIEDSFKRIREVNTEAAEADKKLLELKEKTSLLRFKSSPHSTNQAMGFINLLKQKGEKGLHGCVVDLIKFDQKYATAIDAAGGGRLHYVVVDSADIATKIIEKLKAATSGRVTFIPLKEIKISQQATAPSGCPFLGSLIQYNPEVKRAVDFVFGDSVLVANTKDAKAIGIGTYRMVTFEGELFERSGLVSGGKTESNLAIAAQARKLDAEIEALKANKEELTKELYAIRENESRLRSQKTDIDVEIKTLEMKINAEEDRKKEHAETIKRKERLAAELEALKTATKSMHQEKEKAANAAIAAEKKIAAMTDALQENEGKLKNANEEMQKKRTEQVSKISSLRATIEGKLKEQELRKEELFKKQARLKEIEKEKKDLKDKINEIKRQITNENEELHHQEEKISKYSSEIEQLYQQMQDYEKQLQGFGGIRGTKRTEIDKLSKDIGQLEIKKATVETRLSDISAEFVNYPEFEFLDIKKDELNQIIKDAEQLLASLGNVNMAAIDMYLKKKEEIAEIEERAKKLATEREAILSMISEIDEKKNAAFFDAFDVINENFKKMFKYIDIGEGYLFLTDPVNPFESQMYIRIKRGNKDHSLDSLSGGESSLVALMFIFALQFFKPSPFYILDEVDAALDKENSKRLAQLVNNMAKESQFFVVSHNDIVMGEAAAVIGVTRVDGTSKIVAIKLDNVSAA